MNRVPLHASSRGNMPLLHHTQTHWRIHVSRHTWSDREFKHCNCLSSMSWLLQTAWRYFFGGLGLVAEAPVYSVEQSGIVIVWHFSRVVSTIPSKARPDTLEFMWLYVKWQFQSDSNVFLLGVRILWTFYINHLCGVLSIVSSASCNDMNIWWL